MEAFLRDVTPEMLKAAWVEARRWWPRKVVEMTACKACRQTAGLRVLETCIRVDEPQPGFKEAISAALSAEQTQAPDTRSKAT